MGDVTFNVRDNEFKNSVVAMGKTVTVNDRADLTPDATLLCELRRLREALAKGNDADAPAAAAAVEEAEAAVSRRDQSGVVAALARAGNFALECAKEIGTHLAETALADALHLRG